MNKKIKIIIGNLYFNSLICLTKKFSYFTLGQICKIYLFELYKESDTNKLVFLNELLLEKGIYFNQLSIDNVINYLVNKHYIEQIEDKLSIVCNDNSIIYYSNRSVPYYNRDLEKFIYTELDKLPLNSSIKNFNVKSYCYRLTDKYYARR